MSLPLLALQGNSRQIAAADILPKPSFQSAGQSRGLPVQAARCG